MRTLIVVSTLLCASCAFAQTGEPAPIVAAERAFAADFPALGLAGSFRKWGRPDAILLRGGRARTLDTLFADALLTRRPGDPLLEWWPTFAGMALSGEMGFTTGPVERDQQAAGHYFTVWRRQSDGDWRWVYDGGSTADPTGQPQKDSPPRMLRVAALGTASPEQAMAEVRAVEADFAAAAETDQKAAHLTVLAPDGRLYVGTRSPAEGIDGFTDALDSWPDRFHFGPTEGGGASDAGDMAWTYGPAAWTSGGEDRRGHYTRLWQKRPEGWKLIVAQLVPGPVAPPPSPGG